MRKGRGGFIFRNYNGPREGSEESLPALFDRVHFRRAQPLWDFERFTPDLICMNLGTNDFSTEGADVERFVEAGVKFLRSLRAFYPSARVVLVSGPMQHSAAYKQALRDILERGEIPEEERAIFTMSPQGQLGFGAHWHPSAAQAERNAQELSAFLREWMGW